MEKEKFLKVEIKLLFTTNKVECAKLKIKMRIAIYNYCYRECDIIIDD